MPSINKHLFASEIQSNLIELNRLYVVQSYERTQLVAFIKLLAAFIVYKEGNKVNAQFYSHMTQWNSASLPLQKEIKVTTPISAIMKFLSTNKIFVPNNKIKSFITLLKTLRSSLYDKDKRKSKEALLETNSTTRQYNNLMSYIFTIINQAGQPNAKDNAYNNLVRNINMLQDPLLSSYFIASGDSDGAKAVKVYLKMVKNFMGENVQNVDREFTLERLPKLPESIKNNWNISSSAERKAFTTAVTNIIRSSGEPLMDAEELKEKLADEGMTTWRIPEGFVGKYDDKFKMYLSDGRKLSREQIGGTMEMLPEREGIAKVAHGQGVMDGERHDFQSLERSSKSAAEKFKLVQSILPNLRNYAQQWRADFAFESGKTKLLGALAELTYLTAGRIGSDANSKVSGLSKLVAKNIIKVGDNVKITYIGKKEIEQTHTIKPEGQVKTLLIKFLLQLKEGKKPNDYLWQLGNTTITYNDFKKYLKDEDGLDMGITPHKFRHIRGTQMFQDMLAKYPVPKNATRPEIDKHIQEILGIIGGQLGHIRTNKNTGKQESTWQTAAKSYVDHVPIQEVYKKLDKPNPTWLKEAPEDKD